MIAPDTLWRRPRVATLAVVIGAVGPLLGACTISPASRPALSAEIRRTSFGIPHVRAADEAGIGYGIGYTYAQDNFCLLADEVVTVNGERSRHFGAEAIAGPDVDALSVDSPNRASDLYFKFLNDRGALERAWRAQPPAIRSLVSGYVAGVNRFLAEVGVDGLPTACRGAAWARPLEPLDVMRLMRRYATEFGSLKYVDELVAARPPGRDAVGGVARPASAEPHAAGRRFHPASNAIAVGRDLSVDGRGMLLGQPHLPWHGSMRLYQFHATIPGRLDVMGASLPGLPVVNIGYTRDLAWTHTVDTSAHYTLYRLELHPDDPTRYRHEERWLPLERVPVTIDVRRKDGRLARETHTFWRSIHGPVLAVNGQFEWGVRHAYSIRDANEGNDRMLEAWYAINSAATLDELEQRTRAVVGLPWVNTLAADRGGETLYLNVSVVPAVSSEMQRNCAAGHDPDDLDPVVLDGSRSECSWGLDAAAPQAGIFAGTKLPRLRRGDFVQNANDSAWLTNPSDPLTGFDGIVSIDGRPQGGRTRRGLQLLGAKLAPTADQAPSRITLRELQDIGYDNTVFFGDLLRTDLLRTCDADPRSVHTDGVTVDVAEACAVLARWDGSAAPDAVGYPLFSAWWNRLEGKDSIWRVPFDVDEPVRTPTGVKVDDPSVIGEVRQALAHAVLELQKLGIDWTRPWGEIQYVETRRGRVPVPGGAAGDVLNSIYSVPSSAPQPGRMLVLFGTTYLQVVGFDEQGPVAATVLSYSQSSDPRSPHYDDQLGVFAAGELIAQPFSDWQINADAHLTRLVVAE